VASIETLLDVESMTVDELIGRLKPTESMTSSLNLIEDEHVAHLSSHLKVSGNSGSDHTKEA
jgi:hypothetical protein